MCIAFCSRNEAQISTRVGVGVDYALYLLSVRLAQQRQGAAGLT
jgi:hypothetical protein